MELNKEKLKLLKLYYLSVKYKCFSVEFEDFLIREDIPYSVLEHIKDNYKKVEFKELITNYIRRGRLNKE